MKVLVTGANGLLGSALKSDQDHEMVFLTRDDVNLSSFDDVYEVFSSIAPHAVVHAAALVGGIGGNLMRSGEYFFGNTIINLNVLEAARRSGVTNLISFMSTCVFPDSATYPLTVDQLHHGPPHPSNFGYAYAKRMLETQTRAYNQQWGTKFKVLVPANMYGPHDNFDLDEGHVIPALIHKTFLAKEAEIPLEVWGSGTPLREFVYSRDVAKVTAASLRLDLTDPLIVTNSKEVSIRDLVGSIARLMNFQGPIIWDESKPDGQHRKPSDSAAMRGYFPQLHFTELEDGLKETIDWFLQNYPDVRFSGRSTTDQLK